MAEKILDTFNPENVISALESIIYQCRKNCRADDTHKYFKLFVPEVIFNESLIHYNKWIPFNVGTSKIETYKGYKVIYGYERKIILVHRDYTIFQEDWMYYECAL